MKKLAIAMLLTFAAGTAYAANDMSNSGMSQSAMSMMKKCQGMSQSAMQKNSKCMAMMKEHPDMMKSGTSGSGMSGSSGSGMSGTSGGMKK
jgi:hypothetical protein